MAGTIAMHLLRRISPALLALSLIAARESFADEGLVYLVARDAAPPSYLIGTMHSEDPRVTGLLVDYAPLIEQVDIVAIEILPDAVTLLAVSAATLLPLDQRLSDLIGRERFAALVSAAERLGLPVAVFDRLKPWAAAVTLGMPAAETGRFLDMEIYLHALKHKRRTVALETAAEQLAVLDGMAPDVQLALLDAMIKDAPDLPKQLETLTDAYLDGDLKRLDEVARRQYADMPPAVVHWFDEMMLERRNARMLSRLSSLLDQGSVVAAVGALHLTGENGLIAGLRRQGYRVERR